MEIKDLKEFVKKDIQRLKKKYPYTQKEFALVNSIKLGEEVGELNQEILKKFNYQRKREIKSELDQEIADVIIVASILAESLDIDIEKALKEKIKKIESREK